MVLQHCPVVVENGQAGPGVDMKIVGSPGVVKVVDYGGQEAREDLQVGQPILEKGRIKCK